VRIRAEGLAVVGELRRQLETKAAWSASVETRLYGATPVVRIPGAPPASWRPKRIVAPDGSEVCRPRSRSLRARKVLVRAWR
jgi:hypothetical protein